MSDTYTEAERIVARVAGEPIDEDVVRQFLGSGKETEVARTSNYQRARLVAALAAAIDADRARNNLDGGTDSTLALREWGNRLDELSEALSALGVSTTEEPT